MYDLSVHACAPLPSTSRPRRFQQSQNHSHCIPMCHKSSSVLDIIFTRALSAHSNECLSPQRTSYFMTSSASSAGLMSTQRPRGAACACACACAPFLSKSLALETVCVLRALFSRHPAHRWSSSSSSIGLGRSRSRPAYKPSERGVCMCMCV